MRPEALKYVLNLNLSFSKHNNQWAIVFFLFFVCLFFYSSKSISYFKNTKTPETPPQFDGDLIC